MRPHAGCPEGAFRGALFGIDHENAHRWRHRHKQLAMSPLETVRSSGLRVCLARTPLHQSRAGTAQLLESAPGLRVDAHQQSIISGRNPQSRAIEGDAASFVSFSIELPDDAAIFVIDKRHAVGSLIENPQTFRGGLQAVRRGSRGAKRTQDLCRELRREARRGLGSSAQRHARQRREFQQVAACKHNFHFPIGFRAGLTDRIPFVRRVP